MVQTVENKDLEILQKLEDYIQSLADLEKTILSLFFNENLEKHEIASLLSVSPEKVEKAISDTLQRASALYREAG